MSLLRATISQAGAGWDVKGVVTLALVVAAAAGMAGPTSARDDPAPRPARPSIRGRVLDEAGQPIAGGRIRLYRRASRISLWLAEPPDGVYISPRVGEAEFPLCRRTVEGDAQGRVKFDGIVPGLTYRVQEDAPPIEGAVRKRARGQPISYDEVLVLAPQK